MHIVYVAQFAGAPQYGMILGNYYLAREWLRLGHQVTIITASYAHTRFTQPPQNQNFIREEFIDGIRYVWLRSKAYRPSDRIARIKSIFYFAIQSYFKQLPVHNADLVISSSIHPFTIFPAERLARKFGAKLVMEVRDLWPLTLIELGGASRFNPLIMLMQWTENYAYRNADAVVSVLPLAKKHMVKHGMKADKFLYIPNGVDSNHLNAEPLPTEHQRRLDDFKAQHSFLVGYAGKMGSANALQPLIEAVNRLDGKDVGAVFLGDGSARSELMAHARTHGLQNRILFLPPVAKDQVAEFLAEMDLLYIGLQKKPLFRFGISPTKVNDYLLAAKPVIFAFDAVCEAASDSQAGVTCDPDSVEDIAGAIDHFLSMPAAERSRVGEMGKKWVAAERDYGVLARNYLAGVDRIVEGSSSTS